MSLGIVFAGPSLPPHEPVDRRLTLLPPARHGDVLRAARQRPRMIGLIDGSFDWTRAVWHKEILWAMAQGIHVYGSASMGALRAAELAPFGMQGVGEIFAAFSSGALLDDDEVALLHGPAELGYRPVTEAMVNMRLTFAAAASAGVIDRQCADQLTQQAKAMFYRQRTYPAVLRAAGRKRAALARWIAVHRIDRKQADAGAMLARMGADLDADIPPMQVAWRLSQTTFCDRMWREHGGSADAA